MANERKSSESPEGLAGGDLDKAGGFALKQTPGAAVNRGGIRKPLAAAAAAAVAPAPAPAAPVAPSASPVTVARSSRPAPGSKASTAEKPLTGKSQHDAAPGEATDTDSYKRREVSDIKGLHDNPVSPVTHLSHVMFDTDRQRNKSIVLSVLGVLAAALVALAVVFPKQRTKVLKTLTETKDQLIALARHQKPKPVKGYGPGGRGVDVWTPSEEHATGIRTTRVPPVPRRSCKDLVGAAAGGSVLAVAERVDLADCFMVMDDAASAESALRPLQSKLAHMPESQLNAAKSNRTVADAFLTLIAAYLKEGKTRDADELLRRRCVRWEQTNACVGKAMMLADRRLSGTGGDGGLMQMFETRGRLDGKAQARLWLAGSRISAQDGRPQVADQRYAMALGTAPKDAVALRKQIYEAQAVDLYTRGEVIKLKAALQKALADLKAIPASGRTKLKMLFDLATSPNKAKTLKAMLAREDVTYRARGDFELIEILGPESLRTGEEDAYVRLLQRTREYYTSKYRSLDTVGKKLAVWEIRATLSRGNTDSAMTLLAAYEKSYRPDPLSYHLRGVAYSMASTYEKYQLLAAAQFQAELRVKLAWEPLYALGVTLIRAGKADQVAPVIKDLDRLVTSKGQRYWADMLKAEWYIATGKFPNAQKILSTWVSQEPDRINPRRLQLQLSQKLGRTAEAEKVQAVLDRLAQRQRYASTFEGFASPLGAMALAKRPID